jgi:hypothetical protein
MPVGAIVLARVRHTLEESALQSLRERLVTDLSLDLEEHFYCNGPLIIVKNQNEGPIPTKAANDVRDCWINVNFNWAYYGPGYERGDLELFVICAEWLETQLPGSEIWYGHDVEDDNLHLFAQATRDKFMAYYRQVGSEPYFEKNDERKTQLRALWRE